MHLAPVGALLIGLILGFLKGFQKPRVSVQSTLVLVLVLGMPAIYLVVAGGSIAVFIIFLEKFLLTYLSLLIGMLIGNWIGRFTGRGAS